jgi:uncharacterized protein (TIGR02246 family)
MTFEPSKNSVDARVVELYNHLLEAWNTHDAKSFSRLFQKQGHTVGFDGSPINGRDEIEVTLGAILADHRTADYVGKIREVRFLTPDVALLRAVAGMVSPDKQEIDPAVNAIQTLVAVRGADGWQVALWHNTPARFDGRPEESAALTDELRQLL